MLDGPVAAIVVALATTSAAQPTTELAGQIDLARLVDLAAERAGVRLEYDPSRLQGRVSLRNQGSLSDEQLWALTNRALSSRGLTTVRLVGDDAVSVVPLTEAGGLARVETLDELWATPALGRAGYVTVLYQASNVDPVRLADAARPHISRQGGSMSRVGDSQTLLISDLVVRIEQIDSVLRRLDVPAPEAAVSSFRPTHRSAESLAQLAMSTRDRLGSLGFSVPQGDAIAVPGRRDVVVLASQQDTDRWDSLLASLDQPGDAETVVYAPGSFPLAEVASLVERVVGDGAGTDPETGGAGSLSVVQDSLTNSLVITGSSDQHARVRDLLDRLAATPASERRVAHSFPIRHRAVGEVIDVLKNLLDVDTGRAGVRPPGLDGRDLAAQRGEAMRAVAMGTDRSRDSSPPAAATPVAAPPGNDSTQEDAPAVVLTSDEATNTLIAIGEPRAIAQIEALLETIDVRQPQVMLEVILVSLSEAQTRNLGIELAGLIKTGEVRVRLSSLFGLSTIANGLPGGGVGGAGGTATVLAPEDFALVVRALETINAGRSLSTPRVLVGNGQQASLNSTLGQPVTSVNASDTVATTSFAGFSDAGTQVSITPRIAAGDHLLLEYSITLSAFVGESPGAGIPPPRQQNQLQSVVTIPDGFTIVVGGIELVTEGRAENRVPLLGSIPLIREAFRSRTWNDNRQRFFVFIRAAVDRGQRFDSLRYASEEAAEEAGIDDGWPEVVPRIIR